MSGHGSPAGPPPGGASKAELRRHYRRLRRDSLPAAAAGILAVARRELPPLLEPGGRLGLWWPLAGEPDLRPLARLLPDRLALPAVRPPGELIYLPWRPGEALLADACGIPAPAMGPGGARPLAPGELGLLLVPALAIAPDGLRLGTGGGWYDRLRADPAWAAVPALVVLPAACRAPGLPRDPWDVPFDGWLDETGCHEKIASS
jgi:5-formyltetrahydrofolate cyclo-ligase